MDTITKIWTNEDLIKFKELYPFNKTKELSLIFNRTVGSLSDKANELGLYKNKFNERYFDSIDSPDKAYWIGFIWCDGSVIHRIRDDGRSEYNIKISLTDSDKSHLEKFLDCIDGNYYSVKIYNSKSGYKKDNKESRVFITNQYFGKLLIDKYGIFSNRHDATKLLNEIPKEYQRDFIRGIIDADGSFSHYWIDNNKKEKHSIGIGGSDTLLLGAKKILEENGLIIEKERSFNKRHKEEGRDFGYSILNITGKPQVLRILDWIYKDSNIYLDRKYNKYLNIKKEGGSNVN